MERNLLEYHLEEEIRLQNPGLAVRMQSGENQQHETMDRSIREVLEEHQTRIAALREIMTARFIEKLDRMPDN